MCCFEHITDICVHPIKFLIVHYLGCGDCSCCLLAGETRRRAAAPPTRRHAHVVADFFRNRHAAPTDDDGDDDSFCFFAVIITRKPHIQAMLRAERKTCLFRPTQFCWLLLFLMRGAPAAPGNSKAACFHMNLE